jgi:hypothetical protein
VKLKVGKKKLLSHSHTDTSFKSQGLLHMINSTSFSLINSISFHFFLIGLILFFIIYHPLLIHVAINVPLQSINTAESKGTEVLTSRQQSLTDLFSHLRHPNASVRCDAVSGIREIANRFPFAFQSQFSVVHGHLIKLMLDQV